MSNAQKPQADDPMLARLLRQPTGLRAGGLHDQYQVIATYHNRSGEMPFAICRDGLLLNPATEGRFVPYVEIEDAGYYHEEMVRRAKEAKASGVSQPLSIRLRSGEKSTYRLKFGMMACRIC